MRNPLVRTARMLLSRPMALGRIALNVRALRRATAARPPYVNALPSFIQFESTNVCNLRCVMCGIHTLSKRERRHATVTDVQRIVREIPTLLSVMLQGVGEPLLNPHLYDVISYVKSRGIECGFVTNATLLNSHHARRILAAGVDQLCVSLDGHTRETFESIRVGADFDEVTGNIAGFLRARRAHMTGPRVTALAIASSETVDNMPGIVELARKLGVDNVIVKGLHAGAETYSPLSETHLRNLDGLVKRVYPFPVSVACDRTASSPLRCRWPWSSIYVTVDGEVTPCCNCPDPAAMSMGNIFTASFSQIWNTEAYQGLRRSLQGGLPRICRGCPDY